MAEGNIFFARAVTCKFCGREDCGWTQDENGKWYLVDGGIEDMYSPEGKLKFYLFKRHKCDKGKVNAGINSELTRGEKLVMEKIIEALRARGYQDGEARQMVNRIRKGEK